MDFMVAPASFTIHITYSTSSSNIIICHKWSRNRLYRSVHLLNSLLHCLICFKANWSLVARGKYVFWPIVLTHPFNYRSMFKTWSKHSRCHFFHCFQIDFIENCHYIVLFIIWEVYLPFTVTPGVQIKHSSV